MPDSKQSARGRRSEARDRRRSRVSQPFEELDEHAQPAAAKASGSNGNVAGAAAKVVGTAVAAGLLGALGGAAKALLERRQAEDETERSKAEEPAASAQEHGEPFEAEDEPERPEAEEPAASATEQDESPDAPRPEAKRDEQPEPEARERQEEERPSEVHGIPEGDAAELVTKARRQLEGLLGQDVERVSGLDRADGRWNVMLEVVEVARIPDSTDVMATYQVALDEEGNVVSVNRTRRYRRSQVDDQ